jgi:nitroimidazol reductase NimA-like FMN-containing flavoprotein (pyridoxamine 5'-phosphate oxidase superfamily)
MTERECRAALARVGFGRLGCARDHQPYIVPIYFAYDGHDVYVFSAPGQKIEWMRSNPLVCLEIDERTSRDRWMSVIVAGRYEELVDAPGSADDCARAQQALQTHITWWEDASIPAAEWRRQPGGFTPIFFRIRIEKMTGHRATPGEPG